MRILWINMTVPPEADAQLGGIKELKNTGGWVLGLAAQLTRRPDVTLAIAAASPLVKEPVTIQGHSVTYYIVPACNRSGEARQQQHWQEVYRKFQPDAVHIHGTEYRHALTWLKANGKAHTVVSIQGLVSICSQFYYAGMSQWDVIKNITIRDLYKGTIFSEARGFAKTGESEVQLLKSVDHVIGRTAWDRCHTWSINPAATYHFNNEVLRADFYEGHVWKYSQCCPHTLFLSQCSVPYKGLHILINAMPIILREYPDCQVRVAGFDICDPSFKRRLMRTGYARYVMRLMNKLGVRQHFTFTGRLNAVEMRHELLYTNLFIAPSAIENSCNSLCEAQILGVPCVASRVGGMSDLIPNDRCGLMYRYEESAELAMQVCRTLAESPTFDNTEMRHVAALRHDPTTNVDTLLDIYRSI